MFKKLTAKSPNANCSTLKQEKLRAQSFLMKL
jgi:hypothetical protein